LQWGRRSFCKLKGASVQPFQMAIHLVFQAARLAPFGKAKL